MTNRVTRTIAFFSAAMCCTVTSVQATDTENAALSRVLSVSAKKDDMSGISEVRAAALRSLGRALGLRAGLSDESEKIISEIEREKNRLDMKFNFGTMTFPTGALPPVIEEAKEVVSVMDYSMRIAGKVYKIASPSRFHQVNWRDYLYLGLAIEKDPLTGEAQKEFYPRDSGEQSYWEKVVKEGYIEGRKQAKKVFEVNLARLERDFSGMDLFYRLYRRGLVSAPEIATATDAVSRPDPNTIIIGESVIRITAQPEFQGDASKWRASQ